MQIINATPHALNFILDDGSIATLGRSRIVARVDIDVGEPKKLELLNSGFERAVAGEGGIGREHIALETSSLDKVELTIQTRRVNGVVGLPGPMPDTLYVVSTMVADAAYGREDLVVPGELVRDDAGVIVGCRGLYRVAPACLGG